MVTHLKKNVVLVVMAIVMLMSGLIGSAIQVERMLPAQHSRPAHSTTAMIPHPFCPPPPYDCD